MAFPQEEGASTLKTPAYRHYFIFLMFFQLDPKPLFVPYPFVLVAFLEQMKNLVALIFSSHNFVF